MVKAAPPHRLVRDGRKAPMQLQLERRISDTVFLMGGCCALGNLLEELRSERPTLQAHDLQIFIAARPELWVMEGDQVRSVESSLQGSAKPVPAARVPWQPQGAAALAGNRPPQPPPPPRRYRAGAELQRAAAAAEEPWAADEAIAYAQHEQRQWGGYQSDGFSESQNARYWGRQQSSGFSEAPGARYWDPEQSSGFSETSDARHWGREQSSGFSEAPDARYMVGRQASGYSDVTDADRYGWGRQTSEFSEMLDAGSRQTAAKTEEKRQQAASNSFMQQLPQQHRSATQRLESRVQSLLLMKQKTAMATQEIEVVSSSSTTSASSGFLDRQQTPFSGSSTSASNSGDGQEQAFQHSPKFATSTGAQTNSVAFQKAYLLLSLCANGDKDLLARWREHICTADNSVEEAERIQRLMLKLAKQGFLGHDIAEALEASQPEEVSAKAQPMKLQQKPEPPLQPPRPRFHEQTAVVEGRTGSSFWQTEATASSTFDESYEKAIVALEGRSATRNDSLWQEQLPPLSKQAAPEDQWPFAGGLSGGLWESRFETVSL